MKLEHKNGHMVTQMTFVTRVIILRKNR
jgi:hypothetical protein